MPFDTRGAEGLFPSRPAHGARGPDRSSTNMASTESPPKFNKKTLSSKGVAVKTITPSPKLTRPVMQNRKSTGYAYVGRSATTSESTNRPVSSGSHDAPLRPFSKEPCKPSVAGSRLAEQAQAAPAAESRKRHPAGDERILSERANKRLHVGVEENFDIWSRRKPRANPPSLQVSTEPSSTSSRISTHLESPDPVVGPETGSASLRFSGYNSIAFGSEERSNMTRGIGPAAFPWVKSEACKTAVPNTDTNVRSVSQGKSSSIAKENIPTEEKCSSTAFGPATSDIRMPKSTPDLHGRSYSSKARMQPSAKITEWPASGVSGARKSAPLSFAWVPGNTGNTRNNVGDTQSEAQREANPIELSERDRQNKGIPTSSEEPSILIDRPSKALAKTTSMDNASIIIRSPVAPSSADSQEIDLEDHACNNDEAPNLVGQASPAPYGGDVFPRRASSRHYTSAVNRIDANVKEIPQHSASSLRNLITESWAPSRRKSVGEPAHESPTANRSFPVEVANAMNTTGSSSEQPNIVEGPQTTFIKQRKPRFGEDFGPSDKECVLQERRQPMLPSHDPDKLDSQIYGDANKGQKTRPTVNYAELNYADIDPRIHYTQTYSEDWHRKKQAEITARGSRKENIRKHLQKFDRRREQAANGAQDNASFAVLGDTPDQGSGSIASQRMLPQRYKEDQVGYSRALNLIPKHIRGNKDHVMRFLQAQAEMDEMAESWSRSQEREEGVEES